jgi:CheY-like chemotaxis protein
MVRTVARRLLESFGLTVDDVSGGRTAIERVVADPAAFDAVLLDLTMPEISGPEVLARIREIRPELPVVVMSGYHEDDASKTLGAKISGFVQKPFTPADLARRMRVALEGPPTDDREPDEEGAAASG